MCYFFSFVTRGDGRAIYFDAEDRRSHYLSTRYESLDSHTSISDYFCGPRTDDYVNEYEYNYGQLQIDQINVHDDHVAVAEWIADFITRPEWPELCLAAVQQNGNVLAYIKEQTPEICLAAVKQTGYALYYVKKQTPGICLAAVQQDGYALKYVQEQTPELCLAAVEQDYMARYFCKALRF